jgi:N-acetylglucosamine repressor
MNKGVRGSFQLMKSLNRSIILNKVRQAGQISRAAIAKETKLTPPTVSSIVKELIEAGMIIESAQGKSNGGRKPTLLEINAKNFYIIGLDTGPKFLRTILCDLNGTILQFSENKIPALVTNERLLDLMKKEIQQIIASQQEDAEKIIGIGVGMHGVVDVDQGISLFAPNLHLRDIPIKKFLEKEFDMVVKVENDARTMALGEAWFGHGNGVDNVVTVNIGEGIGAGMIHYGSLFYGENFIAGEIGHMTIDLGGKKCSCGNYGCLQTLASGPAIAERAKNEVTIGKESLLREMVHNDLEKINGEIIHKAAQQGDPLSIEILNSTGIYLGIGLTNFIHTVNPKRIIIGGGVSNAGDYIIDSLQETIKSRALTTSAKDTEIMLSKLGDKATVIGAASLLLVELFSTRHLN